MNFKNFMEEFTDIYGKEFSKNEILIRLQELKENIDILKDIEYLKKEEFKNGLRKLEKSIKENRSFYMTRNERRLMIKILKKLSKKLVKNEEIKKYINIISDFFIQSLENSELQNNPKTKFSKWW